MTITFSILSQASAEASQIDDNNLPNMLSVGDSLMWGQGLRPENRFRELVRQRLAQEGTAVRELSMARSGALLHAGDDRAVRASDSTIRRTFVNPPIDDIYSPADFAREMPHGSLTTLEQLRVAHALLDGQGNGNGEIKAVSTNANPDDILWILLDGGINDVNVSNLLAPALVGEAWRDDFFAGWVAFIEGQTALLKNKMEETLRECLTLFPNARVVVNGYFPIFSKYSMGTRVEWLAVGLRLNVNWVAWAVTNPVYKPHLIKASDAFRWASDHNLREAIDTISEEYRDRTVLFAPSNIEKHRCMFTLTPWLWGFAGTVGRLRRIPRLRTVADFAEFALDLNPEDEVIPERHQQCAAQGSNLPDSCRFASLGHPNRGGSRDYANSIIETLEMAGVISSDHHRCTLNHRRRRRRCREFAGSLGFGCVKFEAEAGRACSGATRTVLGWAASNWSAGLDHATNAAGNFRDARDCFENTAGSMAESAAGHFSSAADRVDSARENLEGAKECWDQTAIDMQECDDERISDIAECEANHQRRLDNECNIRCNSFTDCSERPWWRRPGCYAARGLCVAAAATARTACRAGSWTIKEACKAAAHAKSAACKSLVVLGNVVCSGSEVAKAAGNTAMAVGHGIIGAAAGIGSLASDAWCGLRETGKGMFNIGRGFLRGLAALGITILGGITFGLCTLTRLFSAFICRSVGSILDYGCRVGNVITSGFCWIASPFTRRRTLQAGG